MYAAVAAYTSGALAPSECVFCMTLSQFVFVCFSFFVVVFNGSPIQTHKALKTGASRLNVQKRR